MRRSSLVVLLAALVVGGLWSLQRRTTKRAMPAVERRAQSGPEPHALEPFSLADLAGESLQPVAPEAPARFPSIDGSSSDLAARPAISVAPIRGRVVRPDGSPVAKAEVELDCAGPFRSRLGPLARTTTDADGRFGLEWARAGPLRVLATEREQGRIVAHAAQEDVHPGRGELEIVLQHMLARGRVEDDLGRPIPDFHITWTPLAPDGLEQPAEGERFRDASGEFSSQLSPGEWRASVRARGGYASRQVELRVPPPTPLTIVLPRQGILRGIVVDARGAPVSRASIHAPEFAGVAVSRVDGSFELKVEPATTITVWAEHERHASSPRTRLSLAPGEEQAELRLQLGSLAHLAGEVIGPDGRPVSGREVRVQGPARSGVWTTSMRRGLTSTDATGRFEIDVEPGPSIVSVELGDELRELGRPAARPGTSRPTYERALTLAPGESAWIRLVMGGGPVRLHGRIEVGGRAAAGARVRVGHSAGTEVQYASARDGSYEVLVPEPGLYHLAITVGDMHVQPLVDVPEASEFRFDVSLPAGRIAGRVLDAGNVPLEGVVVDAMSVGEEQLMPSSARARTDRRGAYSMELLTGTYQVSVREDLDRQHAFREAEAQRVRVEPGAERGGVDFVLHGIGTIDGLVRRADGGPIGGARVDASDARLEHEASAHAGNDGRFHLPLDGGQHWITAFGSDGASTFLAPEPVCVELAPGTVQRLELRLVQGVVVRVKLLAGSAEVLPLEALDERGRAYAASLDELDLRALLLPPGSYTLRVRLEERLIERALEVTGKEQELELEWRPE